MRSRASTFLIVMTLAMATASLSIAQTHDLQPDGPASERFDPGNPSHLDALGWHGLNVSLERSSLSRDETPGYDLPLIPVFHYLATNDTGQGIRSTASAPFAAAAMNRDPDDQPRDARPDRYLGRYRLDHILMQPRFADVDAAELAEGAPGVLHLLTTAALRTPHLSILAEVYGLTDPSTQIAVEIVPHRFSTAQLQGHAAAEAPLVSAIVIGNEVLRYGKQLLGTAWARSDLDLSEKLEADPEGVGFIHFGTHRDGDDVVFEGAMAIYRVRGAGIVRR